VFGSLSFVEIAFVLVLALLLFGPKKLPEIGRMLGKGLGEFRRASNELKRTLEREVELDAEEQRRPEKRTQAVEPAAAAPQAGGEGAAASDPEPAAAAPDPATPVD